ncbi:amphi-Trp domain-containing protein [Haloarcula sp. S1AR25-5A]|uniref:Amphi-Trp domain-containing protein n=1 Tax=Haloarcula terrestris TaxID=2950533 RepID=A0AAE4EYN7_9EURY|nr:amphi-Trp domain-containing protein [Haloarcula terrestris]MDS0221627.1 amphi-Trp domain-containing protein [Haloarcula terrestris]
MVETVLFENEQVLDRSAVADYLRTLADSLDEGSEITLSAGSQEATFEPPAQVEFEVKAEREGPENGDGELSIEVELEWPENATDTDLSIE